MHRTDLHFLEAMFPKERYQEYQILIINQTDAARPLHSDISNVRVINTEERGLPRSRNMAIKNAIGDVCLVADDDVRYVQGFDYVVMSAFAKSPSATVITFQMTKDNGELYQQYPSLRTHTKKTLYTVNGVVIAFDRKKLLDQEIWYNNHFGLGAVFATANEYVFMKNVLASGAQALFEPKIILSHPAVSSGKFLGKDSVVYARSALKYKEYGVFAYIWVLKYIRFLIAHKYISFSQAFSKIRMGYGGIKKYRELVRQGLEKR